jgi:hypothetical protein
MYSLGDQEEIAEGADDIFALDGSRWWSFEENFCPSSVEELPSFLRLTMMT